MHDDGDDEAYSYATPHDCVTEQKDEAGAAAVANVAADDDGDGDCDENILLIDVTDDAAEHDVAGDSFANVDSSMPGRQLVALKAVLILVAHMPMLLGDYFSATLVTNYCQRHHKIVAVAAVSVGLCWVS